MFPPEIQTIISTYMIFDFLPLDKVLHFFVGMFITIAMRYKHVRFNKIFLIVGGLSVAKEINDSYVLNSTLIEHILDILVTFIYPSLLFIVTKIKLLKTNHYSK